MQKNCLMFRTDKIGDFICTIPALYELRNLLPEHTLILCVSKNIYSLAKCIPCIDEIHIYDPSNPFPVTYTEYCILFNSPDEIYQHLDTYNNILFIKYRIGRWKKPSLLQRIFHPAYKIMPLISPLRFLHNEKERMCSYVRSIAPFRYKKLPIPKKPLMIPEEYTLYAKKCIEKIPNRKPIIMLSPVKEGAAKTVPEEYYSVLLKRIQNSFPDYHIVILVPPKYTIPFSLEDLDKNTYSIWEGKTAIVSLVPLIDACSIFIGNSHGPTHIACLLQKDILAFYPRNAGASPLRWGPMNKNAYFVLSERCVDTIPKNHPQRFKEKHVERALKYLDRIVKKQKKRHKYS